MVPSEEYLKDHSDAVFFFGMFTRVFDPTLNVFTPRPPVHVCLETVMQWLGHVCPYSRALSLLWEHTRCDKGAKGDFKIRGMTNRRTG